MKITVEITGTSEEAHYPLNWLRHALRELYDKLEAYVVAEAQEAIEYPVIVEVGGELVHLECKIDSVDS